MGLATEAGFGENRFTPAGKRTYRRRDNPTKEPSTMGDRSPKSNQKQASQKQSKADGVSQKKQSLINAQQATKAKIAATKKK
jgi:hypothetical protein